MLMRSDPFRELDRLTQEVLGTRARPAMMPMDAYREGDEFVARFDLPGVDPSGIELTVESNQLTVSAQRGWEPGDDVQVVASERPQGIFARQLLLGEGLDAEGVTASYDNGVLTVRIPVAERARPRRVQVGTGDAGATPIGTGS